MKNTATASGQIIRLIARDTRYGRRVEGTLERIDWSTGEVFETEFKAWGETAYDIEWHRLGGTVGLAGYRKAKGRDKGQFVARSVNELRQIDPRTVDVSAYL